MFDDLDPVDDILLPPVTTTDRKLGKFQPKSRAKPVKVAPSTPKTSDATQVDTLEPAAPNPDPRLELERPYLQPCVSNSSNVAYEHHSMQESVQQPMAVLTESVASKGECWENFQQNRGNLSQDADTCFSLDSPNGPLMTTGNSESVDGFQPKADPQPENKELMTSPNAVLGVKESFCASTLNSSCSQLEATNFQIYVPQQPFQVEPSIHPEASHGGGCDQDRHVDIQPDLANSKKQALAEPSNVESPYDLFHPRGTTELPASKSIDDGLQVSVSDGDLQAFPDDTQEMEMAVLSGLESLNNISFQHSSTADVRQVGKFRPKKNKSQPKDRTTKSVSFILPDASDSASPVESLSETMDPSSMQVMTDGPVDDPLDSSNTTSDWNGEQMDHWMGEENRVEDGLSEILEDMQTEPQSQDVQELKQKIQEGRTTSENDVDAGATKPSRKLRKRIAKCGTDKNEGRSNDDWDIDNFNVSQMDDSQSDYGHRAEEMPKPKRAKRKSKEQTTESEKPARRQKKVSEKPDSAVENSPKKKFPHATRRKRRQVNKVLLQTPEDEIDPTQISIKDLIMLAEAKERISNKEAAAMNKFFSSQSTSSLSNNETTLLGEDQELNHGDEEANHNIQPAPKKLNYQSYMNRPPTVRWSKSETELLYEAIRQFGTDFAMIQQLFPNRTRHQVKLKFKIEERKHPLQVHDALLHPSKDRSHVMQVIKQLQSRAEQTSKGETNGDLINTLQDRVGKNEEETGGIQNEDLQQNGCEGEVQCPEEFNDSKGEVNSPKFNEYETLFEWDSGTYPEDTEKDMLWEI